MWGHSADRKTRKIEPAICNILYSEFSLPQALFNVFAAAFRPSKFAKKHLQILARRQIPVINMQIAHVRAQYNGIDEAEKRRLVYLHQWFMMVKWQKYSATIYNSKYIDDFLQGNKAFCTRRNLSRQHYTIIDKNTWNTLLLPFCCWFFQFASYRNCCKAPPPK